MPFCTECGTRTPTTRASAAVRQPAALTRDRRRPGPTPEASGETTATITFGVGRQAETADAQLNAVDAAAVDALPAGHALLVVQRGPDAGSRFLLDPTSSPPAATPTARSSSTTSPSRAGTRSSTAHGDAFTVRDVGSLNGTYVNRDRIDRVPLTDGDEVQIGKYRLVFFAGRTTG